MSKGKYPDDGELLRLIATGDRKAFADFYTLHTPNLYNYIYSFCRSKETSEEILQDVFVKLWTNHAKLVDIESPKAYLYRCAKNMLLNQIKKNQAEARMLTFSQQEDQLGYPQFSDERIIYSQYNRIAQKAIDELPEKRRKIFQLRTIEDLSLDEIAERLQISKSVVKKQLYSGRDFVRDYLSKAGVLSLIAFILSFIFMGSR